MGYLLLSSESRVFVKVPKWMSATIMWQPKIHMYIQYRKFTYLYQTSEPSIEAKTHSPLRVMYVHTCTNFFLYYLHTYVRMYVEPWPRPLPSQPYSVDMTRMCRAQGKKVCASLHRGGERGPPDERLTSVTTDTHVYNLQNLKFHHPRFIKVCMYVCTYPFGPGRGDGSTSFG